MTSQFSPKVSQVLAFSREEATRLASRSVGPEHLLLGILRERNEAITNVFQRLDVNLQSVKTELEMRVREDEINQPIHTRDLVLNENANNILKLAVLEARIQHTQLVDVEHLLLAILHDSVNNGAKQILEFNNMTYEDTITYLRAQTAPTQDGIGLSDENEEDYEENKSEAQNNSSNSHASTTTTAKKKAESKTPVLDNFSTDLTQAAAEGKLDPVVGREREIQRLVEVLCRRKKNNPILIGEPGVGKSAIAEGLAQLIARRRTSPVLFGKRLVNLDMTSIVAGTKYRGQFEERIKALLKELEQNPDIIVFIDEIHTLIGAGSAAGTMDAANIMKPALARGLIQCIGATTLDEYRNSIEKDGALERRFQKIIVEPTTADETLQILHNIKERYEQHHHVSYTDEALAACVKLTDRYVSDRFFPDKAIDALDETGSRVHLQHAEVPPAIVEKEKEINFIKEKKQAAVANQNFETAASLRDKTEELEKQVMERRDALSADKESETIPVVDENAIRDCISKMTGIPVSRLAGEEAKKLLHLGDEIKERVIGQDQAVDAVVKAIRRTRAGIRDTKRPMGSFLFLGPTGVGKTELAKVLSLSLFGSEDSMIRIDMSEYLEKHSISRLIGAPPGYVGFEESGGQLSEKVRKRPYSVVLLDEIEKAHPDIYNLLLQILDDGILTDSYGRKINFKNTIIIMTSNAGAREVRHSSGMGFTKMGETDDYERMETAIREEVKRVFSPEFLNRIDEQIVFRPLSKADLVSVVDIQLSFLQKNLSERGILLEVTQEAKEFIVNHNYDSALGARPIRRTIQNLVEDEIAEGLLLETMTDFSTITIGVKDGKLSFACEKIPEDGTNSG